MTTRNPKEGCTKVTVRNFYVQVEIDGRKTRLEGGPQAKTGGMQITLLQRDRGAKKKQLRINCFEVDGNLKTEVFVVDEEDERRWDPSPTLVLDTRR